MLNESPKFYDLPILTNVESKTIIGFRPGEQETIQDSPIETIIKFEDLNGDALDLRYSLPIEFTRMRYPDLGIEFTNVRYHESAESAIQAKYKEIPGLTSLFPYLMLHLNIFTRLASEKDAILEDVVKPDELSERIAGIRLLNEDQICLLSAERGSDKILIWRLRRY